ncbi:Rossmann-fold NAD(P)-binding domain-containing protein [Streptomyces eurythermus]|uniref:hypothetical protein n=1 Tax=Streptomyces eurythermus TaxID=42237 RepID=UPI0036FE08FA
MRSPTTTGCTSRCAPDASRGSGRRPGGPDKAAAAVLRIVAADRPPTRLLPGTDALRLVRAGRGAFEREMRAWAELSASTDFDDVSRSA